MATVAEFLIERLESIGVKHTFCVPGDFCLDFIDKLNESKKIKVIGNTDENHSGFAADAYARVAGVGCVVATYNVGALKLCNAIAGAYAEKSPVILISGSPGIKERNEDFLLHHMVRSFENQHEIFKNLTCASVILDNPTEAGFKIDAALEALMHYKQPIYIELPRDVAKKPLKYDVYRQGTPKSRESDPESLADALQEVGDWINNSNSPVILAGVQIARFGLGKEVERFAERFNIPMVTTLLSKSTIDESHPLFAGVYSGSITSKDRIRRLVDQSDCLLILGEMLTDVTLGFETPKFDKRQVVHSSIDGLRVKNHNYKDVLFNDFCKGLFKQELLKKERVSLPPKINKVSFEAKVNTRVTTGRLFEKIDSILKDDKIVVADVGECLFGASDLIVNRHNFVSPAFYCTMGFAIPGALGVQMAKPDKRSIVLVGDGAFQMSCTEISTFLDYNLNPIIFVLNNRGYTTERFLKEGDFNDIRDWSYHKMTGMLCGGVGLVVETEQELEDAVTTALSDNSQLYIVNVLVEPEDISPTLRRMVELLAKRT